MDEMKLGSIKSISKKAEPKVNGKIILSGPNDKIEIIRDKWGIPHLYTNCIEDAFFAQGFTHTQDRLWQMELFRRTASGTSSEIFGDTTLSSDILMRTIGLPRLAKKNIELLHENHDKTIKKLYEPYNKGVNASINKQVKNPPLEFILLDFKPSKWRISDTLMIPYMIAWGLSRNWETEITRLQLIKKIGTKRASELLPFQTTEHSTLLPTVNSELLGEMGIGSNNWVVDGSKSETKKPLLANDPHLKITTPSIWYENHLHCPELHVTGVSFAGFPGVIIGHNENIAWGLTNSGADVQDLYIEKINKERTKVLYEQEWEKIDVIKETFRIKGKETVEKEILITRHGPIIGPNLIKNYPKSEETDFSLRWAAYESESDLGLGFLTINKAENWDEFKEGLALLEAISQNVIYADTQGNIGYYMCGKIPIRKKGQGTVPVPGWIKDYEWEGYIPFWDLPQGYNPSTHLIATANNKVISDSYPYFITHDWSSPFRVRRIVELLSKKKKLNINDFKEIHGDFVSMAVKEILPFLLNIEPENELQKTVQNSLLEWDHELASDSLPALVYEVWINKLAQNILLDKIGEPLFKRIINSSSIINLLKYPGSYWFTGESNSNEVNRDKIILKSLDDALTEIKRRLGENLENWRWGKFHTLSFSHALSSIHGMSEIFDRGPFEMGGDRTTVNLTWFDSSIGYKQSRGVSYRQIIDLDEFSKSLSVHTLGQSGHPFNTHYDDMIQLWIDLEYHPMLWGKNEVIQNMESKLILYPDL